MRSAVPVVTAAELEATRKALLAEEQRLAVEHERLRSTTRNNLCAHQAYREDLKGHVDRIQDYRLQLQRRRASNE